MSRFLQSRFVRTGLVNPFVLNLPAESVPSSDELSFVGSNTSTAASVSVSGLVSAGDAIVLFDIAINAGDAPALVTPGGFTNIYSTSSASPGHRIAGCYKIADGTETTLTGMAGDLAAAKIATIFRGSSAIAAIAIGDIAAESTNGNPASQTCNASGGATPLIVFGSYDSGGSVDPRTFSPAADAEIAVFTFFFAKYKIYNSTPQDTTIDMDDEGVANGLASFYMEATLS